MNSLEALFGPLSSRRADDIPLVDRGSNGDSSSSYHRELNTDRVAHFQRSIHNLDGPGAAPEAAGPAESYFDAYVAKPWFDASDRLTRQVFVLGKRLNRLLRSDEDPRFSAHPQVADPMLETLNFDSYEDYVHQSSLNRSSKAGIYARQIACGEFAVILAIAFLMAVCGYFLVQVAGSLFDFRTSVLTSLAQSGRAFEAYLALIGVSLLYAIGAGALCIFVAPSARGGFVSYVLAYFNGTNVAHLFTWKAVAVKIAALALARSAGLPLGQDIFVGCGIGMFCAQQIHVLLGTNPHGRIMRVVRSINHERVFIACGIAAGLAVMTSAPLTGVVFVMHYSSSFFTTAAYGLAFSCAVVSKFFSDLSIHRFSDKIKPTTVIDISPELHPPDYTWHILELFNFVVLAVLGGFVGVALIWTNVRLGKWRAHALHLRRRYQMVEVVVLTFCIVSMWFAVSYLFGCRAVHPQCNSGNFDRCPRIFCPAGYYSQMGSLVFSVRDDMMHRLFDRSLLPENELSPSVPLVYSIVLSSLFAVSYGMFMPGGPMFPHMTAGAALGRAFGAWVAGWFPTGHINPGVYALLGAGALISGYSRISLPVVVLLIEMTGDATYMLPLMLTTMLAKLISESLLPYTYNQQHMALAKIPVLGENLAPAMQNLLVRDVIHYDATALHDVSKISTICSVLFKYKHTLIPVVDADEHFVGLISRRSVVFALKHMPFYDTYEDAAAARDLDRLKIETGRFGEAMEEAEQEMGDWKDTSDHASTLNQDLADRLFHAYMNLLPFVDTGPLVCRETTPTWRLHAFFRRVGASHVVALSSSGNVLGVLTRRSLLQTQDKTKTKPVTPRKRSRKYSFGSSTSGTDAPSVPDGRRTSSAAGADIDRETHARREKHGSRRFVLDIDPEHDDLSISDTLSTASSGGTLSPPRSPPHLPHTLAAAASRPHLSDQSMLEPALNIDATVPVDAGSSPGLTVASATPVGPLIVAQSDLVHGPPLTNLMRSSSDPVHETSAGAALSSVPGSAPSGDWLTRPPSAVVRGRNLSIIQLLRERSLTPSASVPVRRLSSVGVSGASDLPATASSTFFPRLPDVRTRTGSGSGSPPIVATQAPRTGGAVIEQPLHILHLRHRSQENFQQVEPSTDRIG